MRKLLVTAVMGLSLNVVGWSEVATWNIDSAHTAAQFSVRHMGISTVRGAFTKVSGSVQYDPADVSKTVVDATIDATTIDTRNEMRDKDLRGPNYFDVAKFPTLTFKSKHVEEAGAGKLKVTGDLTIHGVTKETVLDVDGLSAPAKDGRGNMHIGAAATTTINRNDYGVSGGAAMVGNDIALTIDIELVRPAAK